MSVTDVSAILSSSRLAITSARVHAQKFTIPFQYRHRFDPIPVLDSVHVPILQILYNVWSIGSRDFLDKLYTLHT